MQQIKAIKTITANTPNAINNVIIAPKNPGIYDIYVAVKDSAGNIIRKNLKPGQQMPKLTVTITTTHLIVGLVGLPPYLSEDLSGKVKASESLWTLDEGEITITLEKALKAETWLSVFKGHEQINTFQKEEMQKKMLLERFQEEHGGFDFSDAEINGNVPDPKTFMGGIA